MRIVILGATGFIGEYLTNFVHNIGHEVICYGHNSSILKNTNISCKTVDFAISPYKFVFPAIDAVFYLSQSSKYKNFPQNAENLFAVNSQGIITAMKAALEAGCRFFCHASSGSVYTPSYQQLDEASPVSPHSPYAASKLMGEMAASCFKNYMQIMSVRIFGAYGPRQKAMLPWLLMQKINTGQKVHLHPSPAGPDGGLHVSFIYVEDLVKRLLRLAELAIAGEEMPPVLNMAGPEAVSIEKFSTLIADQFGREANFEIIDTPRSGDLNADISLLQKICPMSFTGIEDGVKLMCGNILNE